MVSLQDFPNESLVSTFYGAYFVSYLMLDLMLGMVYYRSSLDPLSGWVHHLAYMGVVSRASMHRQLSTLFAIGTPIEASTILLAAGHIFPRARRDWLFGAVFFGVRIVYPLLILPELFQHVEMRMAWRVAFCALLMHVYWFQRFVQQQRRRWKRKRHVN
ncbi:hypothetical protein DFQ26_002505 [Actinomortierella ambigua]|nr:hypothetical protein DFQ26_002505 [Actinomortierella ambigua]